MAGGVGKQAGRQGELGEGGSSGWQLKSVPFAAFEDSIKRRQCNTVAAAAAAVAAVAASTWGTIYFIRFNDLAQLAKRKGAAASTGALR